MAELVAGFARPRAEAAVIIEVKSSWLLSSVAALRDHGHFDRYVATLEPSLRETITLATVGAWLPVHVLAAHYIACDALGLGEKEQMELGGSVTRRLHGTMMQLGVRVARESGLTPWTALAQAPALFRRVARGGEVSVFKLGPKDARVELLGYPVAHSKYARLAMRGSITSILELVTHASVVNDVPQLCTSRSVAFRLQWV